MSVAVSAEMMPAAGHDRDRVRALLVAKGEQIVQLAAAGRNDEVDPGTGLADEAHAAHPCLEPEPPPRLEVERLFDSISREGRSGYGQEPGQRQTHRDGVACLHGNPPSPRTPWSRVSFVGLDEGAARNVLAKARGREPTADCPGSPDWSRGRVWRRPRHGGGSRRPSGKRPE